MAEVEFLHDPETEQAVSEAVSGIMRDRRGDMVVKLIVLVEIMDKDGDRGMWICESPGMATWDEHGMLGYALNKVRDIDLLRRMGHDV